jgi:hypothetical protein
MWFAAELMRQLKKHQGGPAHVQATQKPKK